MMQDNGSMGNPLANVAAPPQAQGAQPQQGGALARIAPQMGGQQQQPIPNRAQTVAAVKRFSAIQEALRPIISDPDLGKQNIRPEVMDAASKLLGSKLLSISEIMESIGKLPSDPIDQKAFVQQIYNQAQQSESHILDMHGSAIAAGKLPPDGGAAYDAGKHDEHMQSLIGQYKR